MADSAKPAMQNVRILFNFILLRLIFLLLGLYTRWISVESYAFVRSKLLIFHRFNKYILAIKRILRFLNSFLNRYPDGSDSCLSDPDIRNSVYKLVPVSICSALVLLHADSCGRGGCRFWRLSSGLQILSRMYRSYEGRSSWMLSRSYRPCGKGDIPRN